MTVHLESPGIDEREVRESLAALIGSGECHELRGLPSGRSRLIRGSDLDGAVRSVQELAGDLGVYYTLNPVRPELGDRAARVADIIHRVHLLIDCDPVKVILDGMATATEKAEAVTLASRVLAHLNKLGWPLPIEIDSGNGYHLVYKISLPADKLSQQWLAACLRSLAKQFDTATATVDTKVHNASRISKLPGTWVRKGPNTAERPHRIARLISVPLALETVPDELIRSLADISAPTVRMPTAPWTMTVTSKRDSSETYVRSAIERELASVVISPEGQRNDMLNRAAFALGTLILPGHLIRADLEGQLRLAGQRAGLSETEIEATIRSGLDSGQAQPRTLPAPAGKEPKTSTAAKPADGESIILWASDVVPRRVEWLWPDRIPIGKLTTFAGWGGLGKSFVTMDLAARISRGDEIPGGKGECFDPGNVLILNTEDDPDDTSVPRLIEAGADLNKIAFLKSEILGQFCLSDLDTLDRALNDLGGARMLVIDPATAHLGDANDHRNAELRGLLMPLSLWAMTRRLAVILVTHVNKPQTGKVEAAARVVGSVAWVNAVRAAVMFTRDPEDRNRRLFIPFKSNNAPERKGLAYRVMSTETLARVEWLEEVDTSADDAVNCVKDAKPCREIVASTWLIERFREKREWFSEDLFEAAKQEGVSRSAIFEAKKTLCLPRARPERLPGGKQVFVWWVPPDWPSLVQPCGGAEPVESVNQCEDKPF